MKKTNFIKGFTLIELLVVMSIIAILASIMYGPFQTARRRARDTQSIQDMRTLQNYLAIYADDHNGEYPVSLDKLVDYGSVPSRINTGSVADPNKYNYTAITYAPENNASTTRIGYHLWTHLFDSNDALRTDRDCNSSDLSSGKSCWPENSAAETTAMSKDGAPGNDKTKDGTNVPNGEGIEPSQTVCRDMALCILDYAN